MKRFVLSVLALGLLATAFAANKFSASTQIFLQEREISLSNSCDSISSKRSVKQMKSNQGQEMVSAFIRLNSKNLDQLTAQGVIVNAEFSDFVTAEIPVDKLEDVANIDDVEEIDIPQEAKICTAKARDLTYVSKALAGSGLPQAYDGTGVVAGVIDTGIDFNHAAFQDENGNTRIARVYMPASSGNTYGATPTLSDGTTLCGQEFLPEAIPNLTCDTNGASHGTHTSSTLGGSRVGEYSGMAPGVELVLCGLAGNLSDTYIANSLKYIKNYAKSVGKPCVISISLGSQYGPHDGTGYICKAINETAEEGVIVCIATSNEAGTNLYFHKTFENDDTTVPQAATIIETSGSTDYKTYSTIQTYSRDSRKFSVKFVVLDSNNEVVYTSKAYSSTSYLMGQEKTGFKKYYDADFAKYFSGNVIIAPSNDSYNGKYYMLIQAKLNEGTTAGDYRLGILYMGEKGMEIDAWENSEYSQFISTTATYGDYTFTAGSDECSMSTYATAENAISIGAYVSSTGWTSLANKTYTYDYTLGAIAPFSSYGTDAKGDMHPCITAPGTALVAAVNSYNTSFTYASAKYMVYSEANSTTSRTDYYGAMSGTSMACPVAAGIVALWLQKVPTLSPAQVKEIMQETATTDDFTEADDVKFGAGKINALTFLKPEGASTGDVNGDGTIDVEDVSLAINMVLNANTISTNSEDGDIDGNGIVDVTDITLMLQTILGK